MIFIILLVSLVALGSGALTAFNHREVSAAGRLLQGALVGARDKAIHDGQPCGIRLLPDPTYPITWINGQINPYTILAYNRIVPIDSAPEYSEGAVTIIKGSTATNYLPAISNPAGNPLFLPTIVLEEALLDSNGFPNAPTSWFWNVRVGDKVQVGGAGPWYTVIGPMYQGPNAGNSELFVNVGGVGTPSPLPGREFLLLVNGLDDNSNGWIDEGFDGVDNDGVNGVDDAGEWVETESWQGAAANGVFSASYTIRRRLAPASAARQVDLPTSMVIDASTALLTRERSRLPVNPMTGYVDIVLNPDGTVVPTVVYSSPSSFNMGESFYHFWLAERSDLADVRTTGAGASLAPVSLGATSTQVFYLPVPKPGGTDAGAYSGPQLKGSFSLLTLFARTGNLVSTETPPFDDPVAAASSARPFNVNLPFLAPQQGQR